MVYFLLSNTLGFAATITWGTPATISGNTDVNSNGAAIYAYAGTATTVNGVTFTAASGGTTWGKVSFSSFGSFYAAFTAPAAPFSGLSTTYSNVLSSGAYGGATTGTVTLNGLIAGRAYTVQIWVNDSRNTGSGRTETVSSSGGNSVLLDYNNINAAGGVGQTTIGTFVAGSTSQAFTLTSSSSVQLNAISVRDNGYVGLPASYTPSRYNLAKYQPVFTDSTNGTQTPAYLTDGFVGSDSAWMSGSSGAHWAQVVFPFPVTVGSAQLAMGLNNASPLTVFYFQYLTNGNWVTVPGSTVVGNTNVERNVVFSSPITATSFRVYDSLDSPIRLRQLALYPPNGTNGYPFGTDFSIDLARKQPAFGTTNSSGYWPLLATDGLVNSNSAWETTLVGSNSLLINLQFTNKIGSAHLYSGATGVAPLANFVLQYWTGSVWANIPGGSVSGNSSGALVIPFTSPVTTTKVQLVFTNSGTSAVQELCVFPANSNGGYPLGTGIVSNTPVTTKYDTYSDSFYYLSNSAAAAVILESNDVPVMGPVVAATWATQATNWPAQYQVLLNYDNGTYRLINRNSGLCLAGAQLTTNVGALLAEETYSALPDQDWYLQSVDGISFYLVNQFSGLVIDSQGGLLVQNVQTNSPSQYWQISFAQIYPKKGIAGTGGNYYNVFNANWVYSWWYNTGTAFPSNFHYYPMDMDGYYYRNSTVSGNLTGLQPGWRTSGYSLNVLGYNEPDNVGQGTIDPTNGAIAWLNDQNMDLPLAGPAAGNLGGTWLPTFFGYITNWGCRVDYLPGHEYPGNNSGASSGIWINPLQTAYNTWGIPMWMTEFSVVDWSGTGNWDEEDNYTAMAEFLWRAEQTPWLRKHSLFVFTADTGDPMGANPWTRTTPAPRSNAFDTNNVLTPFGELYAAWDDDANLETNKIYYVYNSSTRKQLANMGDPQYPDAKSILVRDSVTKWTLQPTPTSGQYYLVSSVDGRRLSYNGAAVTLVASNTTGTAVQWSLSSYQYGWYYLQHPATGKELSLAYNNSTFTATYSMVANTTTGTAVQWRFIVPYTPVPAVWVGSTNASWVNAANWNSRFGNPTLNQDGNYAVVFNNFSTNNLNTVLNFANNPVISNNFTIYGLTVSNPPAAVSIGATNTLVVGNYIDLSGASQDLTITAPVFIGENQGYGRQLWTVTNGRTLSLNGGVAGANDLIISGGGTVSLGGTNTYTGKTILNAGTFTISGAGQLGAGNYGLAFTDNGVFNYSSSASQMISGVISGSGSLEVNGLGILSLSGANTYTGNTMISGGKLALVGNGLVGSTNYIVAGGATLDVSGLSANFVLGGDTLMNTSVGAVINGNLNCSAGTLSLVTDGTNPAFVQTNGTMTLSAATLIMVNNTGATLATGIYPLITAATTGNPGKVTGTVPSVVISGNGAAAATLQINGSGGLDLVVASTTPNNSTTVNFSFSGGSLTLTWPPDHLGWIVQSNSLDLGNPTNWYNILSSQNTTNFVVPINPAAPQVYFRLRSPF